ncbi:MAG: hypothetical protein NVS3B8_13730 [Chitinophagaceae bacterium]
MLLLLSSCLKDNCRHTYQFFTPVYKKLSEVRAAVQSNAAMPVSNTGKLYIKDIWIFLNEQGKGIHVIDNSNPAHPVKTAFINIPGNMDMSVKGNILYADLYCDLAAINISDPGHINVAKYLTNAFPEKSSNPAASNPDSINIITGWISRDTIVDCESATACFNCGLPYFSTAQSASSQVKAVSGVAGSMARFATVDNYLYAVSTSSLNIIDINEAANPLFVQRKPIGWSIETIFPYHNRLYIGAGNSMSVYDLQNPADPHQLSWSGHWCSGDPVVADDNYAYVTLHEANVCGSKVNQLEIYNLNTPNNPVLVKVYPLASPLGLSKDGNLLFICDEGLKIYDVSDGGDIKLLKHYPGFETYDVIASNGIAYVVAKDGLYQYDYTSTQNIHLLSKLSK